jgi:tRNA-specific 2-thiouridylase
MASRKPKILMTMSGGVDSSVAAALLVRSGKYDVVGAYMLNYDNNQKGVESCWLPDYRDALRVAAQLGIPLMKLDFTKEYKETVLDYMFQEYEAGRTPNPDVLCNKFVKFGSWLDRAKALGFDAIATGHYASVKKDTRGFHLMRAKDDNKDQTYFLHQLTQDQLKHTLFPLGGYTKPEVRALAKKFNLPTADKEESMGICFVGEVPMKAFLETKIKRKTGQVVLSSGEVMGAHDGLPFYTIGQRHLGVDGHAKKGESRPLFVVAKNTAKNELVVGYEDDALLYKKEVPLSEVNWISGQSPKLPLQSEVRLRHRQELQKAVVMEKDGQIVLVFARPQRAVTPGQFAVIYKDKDCLGGGVV